MIPGRLLLGGREMRVETVVQFDLLPRGELGAVRSLLGKAAKPASGLRTPLAHTAIGTARPVSATIFGKCLRHLIPNDRVWDNNSLWKKNLRIGSARSAPEIREAIMSSGAVDKTDIPTIPLAARGKVRDIYDLGDKLLIISTDRISAFDVILPQPIPDKGKVLNGLSLFWMKRVESIVPNHLITADVSLYPEACRAYRDLLQGRSMVAEKASVIPVECVVRGYLIGSGWKDYKATGCVCGIRLPAGLKQAEKLPEPIFTPSTKAALGAHDENISYAKTVDLVGAETASQLKEKSVEIYLHGSALAEEKGIIIADTKFEFGFIRGTLHLVDEALTPDSSRFWPKDEYAPGMSPPSLDKQFVRDYLETLAWDKQPPAPDLPEDIIQKTREKYRRIYEIVTGGPLPTP